MGDLVAIAAILPIISGQPPPGLITEAQNAAAHFGVTDLARSIFVIFSPSGTSAGYNVINAPIQEDNTVVLSHEYAETMSDVNAGWTTPDHTAEIADLCGPDGNLNLPAGSFPVTSLWCNAANACVVSG